MIAQKWGFGMAPIKPVTQERRKKAARLLLQLLEDADTNPNEANLDAISEVKGLFSRSFKCDQWDWFTVWRQLGCRPTRELRQISGGLSGLRKALKAQDRMRAVSFMNEVEAENIRDLLNVFIGEATLIDPPGIVYALGTRESKDLLKVGMTTRDVVTRVNEINSATGVAIPYGVRGTWAVSDPKNAERAAHQVLAPYRIRSDREFFHISFYEAKQKITAAVSPFKVPLSVSYR